MSIDITAILLAIFVISFIVFIHELGHYWMARRVGMKVEVFSIGFGKPIFFWTHKGVKWQVCILPFGGYVRVRGLEGEKDVDPHDIKGGFFNAKPYQRILMAAMGPIVNIVFAFAVFTGIWMVGGRNKPFAEHTSIVGWVDPDSKLARDGVGPGSEILTYNGDKVSSFKDIYYQMVKNHNNVTVTGEKIDYLEQTKTPFSYNLETYPDPRNNQFQTIGIIDPAKIIVFHDFDKKDGKLSPLADSGIQKNDRIIWADGEIIFSDTQLRKIVNDDSILLTAERGEKTFLARVPRVKVSELQLSTQMHNEVIDWKRELNLSEDVKEQYFLPYEVNDRLVVQSSIPFIDSDLMKEQKVPADTSDLVRSLKPGDRILSAAGVPVQSTMELFTQLRERKVRMMTQSLGDTRVLWKDEDTYFIKSVQWENLSKMIDSFGTTDTIHSIEGVSLLKPVVPLTSGDFYAKTIPQGFISEHVKQIGKDDAKFITLGAAVSDKLVIYNPNPLVEMKAVCLDFFKLIGSLLTGGMSPKWLSGPVGMVTIVHAGAKQGITDLLYWMALISFNLGAFNLLPIPMLDGGHICFALYEWVTKKQLSPKAMERMVLPFAFLLIATFIYVTFQDVSRLIGY